MKKLFPLFVCFLMTSCALDIDYHMPINRFDTPEVSGEFLDGKVEMNIATAHKVTLGEIWEDRIFGTGTHTDEEQYMETSVGMNLAGDLGLLSWLDVFYRVQYDSTDIFGLKAQLWGSGRNKKEEGLKIAVTAGMGSEALDEDGLDIQNDDGSDKRKIESKLDTKAYDGSVIIGYRLNSKSIVYLTNYYTHYQVNGYVKADDGSRIEAKGISHNYGSLLGARMGEDVYLVVEGGYSRGTFEQTERGTWAYGLALGYSW